MNTARWLVSALVGFGVLAAGPATAHATGDAFTCNASAIKVTALNGITADPEVANAPDDPCVSAGASTPSVSLPHEAVTDAASAKTVMGALNVTAGASVGSVDFPRLGIAAQAVRSATGDHCTAQGTPQAWARSQVVGLTVDGRPITTSGQQIPLGIAGSLGVATINLDETIPTVSGVVTQRAVDITITGGADDGARIILGEATTGTTGNPCALRRDGNPGSGGGFPPEGGAPPSSPPSSGTPGRRRSRLPYHGVHPRFSHLGRLLVTNVPSRRRVHGGQVFDYRVTVRSVGRYAARRVRACDRLPRGLTFASVPARVVLRNGTACWNIGMIRPHHRRRVTERVRALTSSSRHTAINRVSVVAGHASPRVARARPVTILPARPSRPAGVTG